MLKIVIKIHNICEENNITYFLSDGTLLGAVRHKGFIPWDDDLDIAMPRDDYEKFKNIAQKELGDDFFLQTIQTDPNYNNWYIPMKVRDNHSTYVEKYGKSYHEGVYVDIFPLDRITDTSELKQKKLIYLLSIAKGPFALFKPKSLQYWTRIIFQICLRFIPNKLIIKFVENAKAKNQERLRNGIFTDDYIYGFETPWSLILKKDEIFPTKLIEFEGEELYAPHMYETILKKQYGDYMRIPPENERVPHHSFFSDEKLF